VLRQDNPIAMATPTKATPAAAPSPARATAAAAPAPSAGAPAAAAAGGEAKAEGKAEQKAKKSVTIMAPEKVDKPAAAPAAGGAAAAAAGASGTPNTTVAGDDGEDKDDELGDNTCRMYEQKYPEADDLVVVQVKNVAEMGAYVSLLEYGGVEGMILLSELSRRCVPPPPNPYRSLAHMLTPLGCRH
jgi:hypothetical protein